MFVLRRKKLLVERGMKLPFGAEFFFPFPKISWVADTYLGHLDRTEAYRLMTHSAIAQLAKKYRFHQCWRERDLPQYLRQTKESEELMRYLEETTPGDTITLAVQCGSKHLMASADEVKTELKVVGNEFCLGLFHVACLGIAGCVQWDSCMFSSGCAGDEMGPGWDRVPILNGYTKNRGSMVEVAQQRKNIGYYKFGMATAFLPEGIRL